MARRPRQPTPEERALWAKVAATVDPLRRPDMPGAVDPAAGTRAPPVAAAPTPGPTSPPASTKAARPPTAKAGKRGGGKATTRPAAPDAPAATVYTPPPALKPAPRSGDLVLFGQMDRRSHDKLRRGRFVIDSRLDLHGMTQAQAHGALKSFVLDNHRRGRRKLLVITGKGGGGLSDPLARPTGVLRGKLKQWLQEPDLRPLILGLEPARPDHGGAGAFYLLLRRVREG